MPSPEAFYAVDRIEGAIAVLVGDDAATTDLERSALPARIKEGTVIRVSLGSDGQPDWSTAEIDEKERSRRLKTAQERLKKLSENDPGGDIML
jgi:hypothetical protein